MAGDQYVVMQGTIQQATLHDKLQSCNLSRGCFKKYFNNGSGDIVMMFDGCETSILSPIIMFFGKPFDQLCPWGPVFFVLLSGIPIS